MAKKKKYVKGGKLNGKPHSKGGININVEGGEYIIKKDSVNAFTEPILQEINKTGKLEYRNGGKIMPTVKNKKGETVATMPYTTSGQDEAEKMAQANPEYTIVDAPDMREQMYAGGGKVGYSKIGMYKKGGKV